jgi:hypothetical protein
MSNFLSKHRFPVKHYLDGHTNLIFYIKQYLIDLLNTIFKQLFWETSQSGFTGICADMCALPFADNSFDKVLSMTAIEFVKDAKKVIREKKTILIKVPFWLFNGIKSKETQAHKAVLLNEEKLWLIKFLFAN